MLIQPVANECSMPIHGACEEPAGVCYTSQWSHVLMLHFLSTAIYINKLQWSSTHCERRWQLTNLSRITSSCNVQASLCIWSWWAICMNVSDSSCYFYERSMRFKWGVCFSNILWSTWVLTSTGYPSIYKMARMDTVWQNKFFLIEIIFQKNLPVFLCMWHDTYGCRFISGIYRFQMNMWH